MSRTRKRETVRSRALWGLAYLAVFAIGGWLTIEPGERVRWLSIFVPLAAGVYAVSQWFYVRRNRLKREELQGPTTG